MPDRCSLVLFFPFPLNPPAIVIQSKAPTTRTRKKRAVEEVVEATKASKTTTGAAAAAAAEAAATIAEVRKKTKFLPFFLLLPLFRRSHKRPLPLPSLLLFNPGVPSALRRFHLPQVQAPGGVADGLSLFFSFFFDDFHFFFFFDDGAVVRVRGRRLDFRSSFCGEQGISFASDLLRRERERLPCWGGSSEGGGRISSISSISSNASHSSSSSSSSCLRCHRL